MSEIDVHLLEEKYNELEELNEQVSTSRWKARTFTEHGYGLTVPASHKAVIHMKRHRVTGEHLKVVRIKG